MLLGPEQKKHPVFHLIKLFKQKESGNQKRGTAGMPHVSPRFYTATPKKAVFVKEEGKLESLLMFFAPRKRPPPPADRMRGERGKCFNA